MQIGPNYMFRNNGDGTFTDYASTNDPRILAGLRDATEATKVRATWPDGSVEEWTGLPVDKYTTLAMGSGTVVKEARAR